MKAQITAGMNFALSGIPYWTMDIGGFCVEKRYEIAKEGSEDLKEWRELNTRWYQFGAFVPLFRAHGQYPYREVFNVAPESHSAYQSILYYNKLRYRLMPYIYSLAGQVYFDDYTIMRALVMDFPEDKKVVNLDDQYMFGPSLMICPVYTYGARERAVYLPEGTDWYDVNTGERIKGGQQIEADAPYERMPMYIKAGSILPVGPEIEYTDQKLNEAITIAIYEGADGSFTLYEDEGLNYNYEKGECTMIPFKWDDKNKTLTIDARKGSYKEMQKERIFKLVLVSAPDKISIDDIKEVDHKAATYRGDQLVIQFQ
ncbi:alpha-xylosidase [Saccharicrinis fermentans DSM 9555 = JCM 21142]|uniref:Alpha-xylosidase n=3 Tax=Saccharicrinis fermentans TaxID=982 RepID=W7YHA7_9BACT|nr:alpha-xylosidase [Saccharicrinis fermentans DSM 9555 = JCM 21142]